MRELLKNCQPFSFSKQSLNESSATGKLVVSGVLQRAEAKNQNGRIYPAGVLQSAMKKYEENFIRQKRAMGELDHPDSEVVNLKNVSHNILRVWWSGQDLMGEVEILTTPSGNILKELLKCGIVLGISSRGAGSVEKVNENTVKVNSDFELIAFDFVSNPSTFGAFMYAEQGNLNESAMTYISKEESINQWEKVESIVRDILSECK